MMMVHASLVALSMATSDPATTITEIGTSRGGVPIEVLRVALERPDALGRGPDERPAVLVVAGVQGDHRVGSAVALGVAERIRTEHAALFENTTLYVVAVLNPDGRRFDEVNPAVSYARTIAPSDADRDGRISEDGGEDLNGDGLITMMRMADPTPGSGITATVRPSDEDDRVMVTPKDGEHPTHALFIEGIDNDGDGAFNEDGIGGSAGAGVDLDKNFPARWPEYEDGAGRYPLSEPESLALLRWVLARDNIGCVLVFGPHDNLVNAPAAGKFEATGRIPTGIEEGDKALYDDVAKAFKQITSMTGAPKTKADGSFVAWAYTEFGVPAFATPVWVRPDLVSTEDEADAEDAGDTAPDEEDEGPETVTIGGMTIELTPAGIQAAMAAGENMSDDERRAMMREVMALPESVRQRMFAMAEGGGAEQPTSGRGGRRGSRGGSGDSKVSGDDAKWIAYSDGERDGTGFVEWEAFAHPQLGPVEIGGFVPGFRTNPPESEHDRLIGEQTAFVADLLGRLPRIKIDDPVVERLGPGLWRVAVRIRNDGVFPVATAMGVKARRIPPTRIVLDVEVDTIVSGSRLVRATGLAGGGGTADAEWVIRAEDGSAVAIDVLSRTLGDRRVQVQLGGEQ